VGRRADMLQNEHWALAPANYHGTKKGQTWEFFRSLFSPYIQIHQ
jgi:hypothetical protein